MTVQIDAAEHQTGGLSTQADSAPAQVAGRIGNQVLAARAARLSALQTYLLERAPNDALSAMLVESALTCYRTIQRAGNSRHRRGKQRGPNASGVAATVNALFAILDRLGVMPDAPKETKNERPLTYAERLAACGLGASRSSSPAPTD